MIPDILKHFDLPQVAAAVADRRLTLLAPVDAMKSRVGPEIARQISEPAAKAYSSAAKPERFLVADHSREISLAAEYLQLPG